MAGHVPVFTDSALALRLRRPLGPAFTYGVTALVPQVKPADLVGRGRGYPPATLPDTMLPFPAAASVAGATAQEQWLAAMNDTPADREWRGLYQLNRQIVRAATDPYQITLRIEQYLRSHYTYSLTPPPTRYRSPYAAFLFDTRTGYCQHFAGAMAVLVRFNGIPARVAVGFTTGALVGQRHLRRRQDRCPRLGRGLLPRHRLGDASTPHRAAACPAPARRRRTPASSIPFARTASRAARPPPAPRRRNCRACSQGANAKKPNAGYAVRDRTLDHAGLAALGPGIRRRPAGLAVRPSRRAPQGSAPRRRRTAACAPRSLWSTPSSTTTGSACRASQTLEETARLLKEYLGLDATSLTDRAQAVLFGGRAADEQRSGRHGRVPP